MIRIALIGALLFFLSVINLGCSKGESEEKRQSAGRPPVAVEVTRVTTADLTDGIDIVGSLSPKFATDVKSEYAGIVTEVYVTEWVGVKKGDLLARTDTREAEIVLKKARAAAEMARANLLQAEVAKSRADREYNRLQKLRDSGVVAQQNLDDARTEKEAAAARISPKPQIVSGWNEGCLHSWRQRPFG